MLEGRLIIDISNNGIKGRILGPLETPCESCPFNTRIVPGFVCYIAVLNEQRGQFVDFDPSEHALPRFGRDAACRPLLLGPNAQAYKYLLEKLFLRILLSNTSPNQQNNIEDEIYPPRRIVMGTFKSPVRRRRRTWETKK